jgi:hypothetical protein
MVGVDRLEPGDHAFLSFADDAQRWEILGMFTQHGLAMDEKVMLSVDTARPLDEVAAQVAGSADSASKAMDSGQLVISGAPRFQPDGFDPGEFATTSRMGLDAAVAEGYSGLRTANELSLALIPLQNVEAVVEFERAVHGALRDASTGVRYTALCHWDESRLGGGPVLEAVRALHPVTVLPAPGTLHVIPTETGIRLTGDSDLSTRDEFTAAMRLLEDLRPPAGSPLVLDLSDLSFIDAHSIGAVLRLAAALTSPRRLEVHCRTHQRRMLHVLGARSIRQLTTIITERVP